MYRQTDRQAGGVALTASLDRQLQLTLAVSLDVFARQSLFFFFLVVCTTPRRVVYGRKSTFNF